MIPYADENPARSNHEPVAALILVNVLVWAAFHKDRAVIMDMVFIPARHAAHTWITSQFLHIGLMHLLSNMWVLWLFGQNVAARLGRWFVPFYLTGGVAADLLHYLKDSGSTIPSLGASGAIFAVVGAYVVLFPRARMKCVTWLIYRPVFFSLSALLLGIIYLAQDLLGARSMRPGTGGVGHWAHLGGLAFGAAVGLRLRMQPDPEAAVQLSGESEAGPSDPVDIIAALAAGDHTAAVHRYVEAAQRDRTFELPDAQAQIVLAQQLSVLGHPHFAREAAERFLRRHPQHPLVPYALLVLGYVEQHSFKELDAALKHFQLAAAHPAATPEMLEDARQRVKEAREALDKNEPLPAAADEPCSLVFEGTPPLSAGQLKVIGRLLETQPGPRAGFLAMDLPGAEAVKLAAELEKLEVPVVVLPASRKLRLAAPRAVATLDWDASGLTMTTETAESLDWTECLLIAALRVPKTSLVRERKLLHLELGSEDSRPMVEEARPVLRLEILTLDGRRYQWTPEDADLFFTSVRGLLGSALQVPIEGGARAAFGDETLPDTFCFSDAGEAEDYLLWQAQLARLKRAPHKG